MVGISPQFPPPVNRKQYRLRGGVVDVVVGYVVRSRRRLIVRLLSESFPEKSNEDINAICNRYYRTMAEIVIGTMRLAGMKADERCKCFRYELPSGIEEIIKGKNIAEVLDMTVDEAVTFFENIPRIHNRLKTLQAVGLGYVKLGQPATTLSGGEAQRVKLATELSKRSTGRTLYILDEPTTGLHIADVDRLIGVLQQLCEGGNTVVIIEHNMDVIKISDYLIDLGPEGGERGGEIIGVGTPEELMENEQSYTGQFLKKHLKRRA